MSLTRKELNFDPSERLWNDLMSGSGYTYKGGMYNAFQTMFLELEELPRNVLNWYYYYGCSYEEISIELGVSSNDVAIILSNAINDILSSDVNIWVLQHCKALDYRDVTPDMELKYIIGRPYIDSFIMDGIVTVADLSRVSPLFIHNRLPEKEANAFIEFMVNAGVRLTRKMPNELDSPSTKEQKLYYAVYKGEGGQYPSDVDDRIRIALIDLACNWFYNAKCLTIWYMCDNALYWGSCGEVTPASIVSSRLGITVEEAIQLHDNGLALLKELLSV